MSEEWLDLHNLKKETQMSKPKTTSELIHTYAGILNDIVREGTQGSYTYHGVLGCFLNEWLEMDAEPEALEEPLPAPVPVEEEPGAYLEALREKLRKPLRTEE